jgi:hypothetical protein
LTTNDREELNEFCRVISERLRPQGFQPCPLTSGKEGTVEIMFRKMDGPFSRFIKLAFLTPGPHYAVIVYSGLEAGEFFTERAHSTCMAVKGELLGGTFVEVLFQTLLDVARNEAEQYTEADLNDRRPSGESPTWVN